MAHSGTTKLLAYMLLCLLLTISAWDSVCHAEETKPVEVKLLFIVEKSARIALSDEPHGIQNRIGIAREKLNTLLRNSGLNQRLQRPYGFIERMRRPALANYSPSFVQLHGLC